MTSPQPAPSPDAVVIGVDYGTLSGRAVVVRVRDGAELASAVLEYPHAVLDRTLPDGTALPPEFALQVPADYVEVLRRAVPEAVRRAGIDPADVIGLGTDFTACTMVPTTADGTPLNELDGLAGNPHAYVKLWRHHAAQPQADRINALAAERKEAWLPRYGGLISSEWEFAKGLEILEEAPEVYATMEHWVEAADWIVWQLTGDYVRNACTAGYKGIYQDGSYPSEDFLAGLNPDFRGFVADKVEHRIGQLGERAGRLSAEAAAWTGLPEGIAVAVGNVDAHVTAPAARAVEPGQMVAIMGTSTCHVMNSTALHEVPGMCGVVDGGIVAGLWGYEAGQSGVGDIFGWFVKHGVPPEYHAAAAERGLDLHEHLTDLASRQADRRARPGRPRLAQRQPVGPGRPRAVRPGRRPDAGHPRRGHLPRAAGGHGLRHPHHRRGVRRRRRPGHRARRRRRPAEEPAADADLRRRDQPAVVHHRLRAGPGAGLGHPRRGRRRRLRRRARGRPGDGPLASGASTSRSPPTSRRTTRCSPSTRCCTTTSAAAPTTSCTGSAPSGGRRPGRPRRRGTTAPADVSDTTDAAVEVSA